MPTALRRFFTSRPAIATETVGDHRVTSYLSAELPPLAAVRAVRAVVLSGDQMLIVESAGSVHALPGGPHTADEEPQAALGRELRAVSGWAVTVSALLGCKFAAPLGASAADEWAELIYLASADHLAPPDAASSAVHWEPLAQLHHLGLARSDRAWLDAAVRLRATL